MDVEWKQAKAPVTWIAGKYLYLGHGLDVWRKIDVFNDDDLTQRRRLR